MKLSPIVLLHTDEPESARDIVLRQHGDLTVHLCDTYADLGECLSRSQAEVVYSVRFDGTPKFPRQELLNNQHVKWISVGGSGTDHLLPWDSGQLTVTNAAGVAADIMAEYVLGCLLSFRLDLRGFQHAQQKKQWLPRSVTPVAGQTALLIGLGHTGVAVARRFKSMDMRVIAVRANPASVKNTIKDVDAIHLPEALPNLLPQADVVVVAVPLLPSTKNLLSDAEFAAMKANTILVDISRGGVVNESALVQALSRGTIEGAALDVFTREPLPVDHSLWEMENVIITPHCSSVYDGWELRSVEMFADNLDRYRQGQPLDRVVDPQKGY